MDKRGATDYHEMIKDADSDADADAGVSTFGCTVDMERSMEAEAETGLAAGKRASTATNPPARLTPACPPACPTRVLSLGQLGRSLPNSCLPISRSNLEEACDFIDKAISGVKTRFSTVEA